MSNAPKVHLSDMQAKIVKAEYLRHGVLTFCVLHLKNGFTIAGEPSACVSEANYNQALGEKYAYENAIEKMWALEGYLLKEQLYQASLPQTSTEIGAETKQIAGFYKTAAG